MKELSSAYLKSILRYDPEAGLFIRLVTRHNHAAGTVAGYQTIKGYINVSIDKEEYKAHRLAWFYMTGKWPACQIDYINMEKGDNRFSNLREATNGQNQANSLGWGKSGLKGAVWSGRYNVWIAQITENGKRRHLGTCASAEEAHALYAQAARRAFGEFARIK